MKIKLEIKRVDEGKEGWGLYRLDRTSAIIKGITKAHAEHLKVIVGRMEEVPDRIEPIKDWYDYDEIVDVDEKGHGK